MTISTMKTALRFAATGVAVVLASATVASAFQLEPKGTAQTWRSDLVKQQNTATLCLLKAWNKCETAATTAGLGSSYRDCDITITPVPASTSNTAKAITDINTEITACLAKASGTSAKVGFSKKRYGISGPDSINFSEITLADIGCLGDCNTADGTQSCASNDVENYELTYQDANVNALRTAAQLSDSTNATINLLLVGCGGVDLLQGKKAGTNVNLLAGSFVNYSNATNLCAQKCQDDMTNKAGNGFFNDTTNCIVPTKASTATPYGLSSANPFEKCLIKAEDVLVAAQKLSTATPVCGGPLAITSLVPLVDAAVSAGTNSSYDRLDLQTSQVLALTTNSLSPFFAGAGAGLIGGLADRSPGIGADRQSFGTTCASCGDGVLRDYEECDSGAGNNALCGGILGTLAGTCPTIDDAATKTVACRCPRP